MKKKSLIPLAALLISFGCAKDKTYVYERPDNYLGAPGDTYDSTRYKSVQAGSTVPIYSESSSTAPAVGQTQTVRPFVTNNVAAAPPVAVVIESAPPANTNVLVLEGSQSAVASATTNTTERIYTEATNELASPVSERADSPERLYTESTNAVVTATNAVAVATNEVAPDAGVVDVTRSTNAITQTESDTNQLVSPTSRDSSTNRIYEGTTNQLSTNGLSPTSRSTNTANIYGGSTTNQPRLYNAQPQAGDQSANEADRMVVQNIRQSLTQNPSIAQTLQNVNLSAENGKITLRGSVPTEQDKRNIEAAAKLTTGVVSIDNQLEIKPAP